MVDDVKAQAAVEAAAPTPRYEARESRTWAGWWCVGDTIKDKSVIAYPLGYPGGAEAAAVAEARRLNEMEAG